MGLSSGTLLGPYEILATLGAGGMGEVYRARDTRLGRQVAIKVIPTALLGEGDRLRRFEQEARSASALTHPNILTIFDLGTHEGAPFLVMELLEGQTLTERLSRARLPIPKALDYAVQMAQGLAAAHAKGIVHRDLKPDNVFITTQDRVKLLDFGLAKQLSWPASGGQTELPTQAFGSGTEAGVILGSVGYLSPEQARGEAADTRSDVFSFGCVLYEMLGGRRAFAGGSAIETLHAILKVEPPRLATQVAGLPSDLERTVERCLAKRPEERYASAVELARSLQALAPGPASDKALALVEPQAKSLLVLPFADLSPGKDNEYFADGLTEELIGDLSRIGSLRVISRTTAMGLKHTPKSLPILAQELAVRFVLEGSVRRAGNNLRISAQLVDAATDAHLWSKKFNGTLDDVFDIQERVSRAITEALKVRLTDSEDRRMAKRPMASIKVFDGYLKARMALEDWSLTGLKEAERLLIEGLELAEDNPLLLAGLAKVYFEHVDRGLKGEEGLAIAEAYAQRALAQDPECAPALLVLGLVQHFKGNLEGGIGLLKRALETDPNDTEILFWFAWFKLWITGQAAEALVAAERALALDPGSPLSHLAVGWVHYVEGRADQVLQAMDGLPVEHPMIRYLVALALDTAGRRSEALALLASIEPQPEFDAGQHYCLLLKFALQGEVQRFPDALRPEFVRLAELDACTAIFFALSYALAGQAETAMDWLEKAIPRGYFNHPYLSHHPHTAALRGHPRFERILAEVKQTWGAFKA